MLKTYHGYRNYHGHCDPKMNHHDHHDHRIHHDNLLWIHDEEFRGDQWDQYDAMNQHQYDQVDEHAHHHEL